MDELHRSQRETVTAREPRTVRYDAVDGRRQRCSRLVGHGSKLQYPPLLEWFKTSGRYIRGRPMSAWLGGIRFVAALTGWFRGFWVVGILESRKLGIWPVVR